MLKKLQFCHRQNSPLSLSLCEIPPASSFFISSILFPPCSNWKSKIIFVIASNTRSRRYKFWAPTLPESKTPIEKPDLLSSNSLISGDVLATHDYWHDHRHETDLTVQFFGREVAGKRRRLRCCRGRGERNRSKSNRFLAVRSDLTAANISCININLTVQISL